MLCHTLPATIPKQKQMAGQWVEREALTDERRQADERSPQIDRPGRQVNPNRGRERQHSNRSAVTTARTRSAEAPVRTCSRSPQVHTISITGASASMAMRTGTNVADGGSADAIHGSAASLRHQYHKIHAGR
jgi:hypothetical protein